jgi:methyl-accepting chemotaxis protein
MRGLPAADKIFDEIELHLKELDGITRLAQNREQLTAITKAGKEYRARMAAFKVESERIAQLNERRRKTGGEALAAAFAAAHFNLEAIDGAATEAAASLATTRRAMLIGLAVMVLLGAMLAWVITSGIMKQLLRIIADLASCSEQTASASEQVAQGAQQLASGTSENAAALEETSASMEEMNALVRQSSQSSESAAGVAAQARQAGERGAQAMRELAQAISDIKSNADQTAKIVKTIDEIAFQTNLLALNAAVEAARAGEAGKGFAVVAEEVRNLAQRAGEAARTTAGLIETSVKSAETGVNLSKNVSGVVGEMTQASTQVNTLVGEIATSAREVAQGIEQVTKAVRQMDQVTQSNAASAEENSAVGEELSAQAVNLAEQVQLLESLIRVVQARQTVTGAPPASRRPVAAAKSAAKPATAAKPAPAHAAAGDAAVLKQF